MPCEIRCPFDADDWCMVTTLICERANEWFEGKLRDRLPIIVQICGTSILCMEIVWAFARTLANSAIQSGCCPKQQTTTATAAASEWNHSFFTSHAWHARYVELMLRNVLGDLLRSFLCKEGVNYCSRFQLKNHSSFEEPQVFLFLHTWTWWRFAKNRFLFFIFEHY